MKRAAVLALLLTTVSFSQQAPITVVDPTIGSTNGGNTTPGAQVPFGLVSLGPDTAMTDFTNMTNAYNPAADMTGFSHTHESGTGGAGKYGNFRVTPTVGPASARNLIFPWKDEHAEPGYYAVTLGRVDKQIRTELTATRLVGYSRYTFPQGAPANLLLDVSASTYMGHKLDGSPAIPQAATDGAVTITDARHAEGFASFVGGWNPGPYTLYFAVELSRDATASGTWDQAGMYPDRRQAAGVDQRPKQLWSYRNQLGAFFTFDTASSATVEMRLAVSYVSVAQAKATLASEQGLSFEAVRAAARDAWTKTLAGIVVEGGTPDQRTIFYSALYRAHIMPHDLTGENVWWSSKLPHYEDFYTLWDTFRTLHPLFTLLEPERQTAMVQSLLDTYAHTGWLPDARIAGSNGLVQGGTNGDVLIADALVKHLPGVDTALAWAALKKDAEVGVPLTQSFAEGRELDDWKRVGYVSLSTQRSASRTLEYAADDYAIATAAHLLGHDDEAQRYLKTSANWKHLWDAQLRCIHPKYADGAWLENFDCDHNYPDNLLLWWDTPFYEGNASQYSTYVPQDSAALIETLGGPAAATVWLDRIFDRHIYTQGNEPDILAPYLYLYMGRPDRTAERVRDILANEYRTGRAGLPGNDDAGTMSSWYIWGAIGLYPVAGQPLYLIGSPIFPRITVKVGNSHALIIRAERTSDTAKYVQSAQFKGKPLHRAWLTHEEIVAGAELVLQMGEQPGTWATELPPSGADVWKLVGIR